MDVGVRECDRCRADLWGGGSGCGEEGGGWGVGVLKGVWELSAAAVAAITG